MLMHFSDMQANRQMDIYNIYTLFFFFFFFSFILSHFYVGSMYDDIRLHVARSYTSSADSPFCIYIYSFM